MSSEFCASVIFSHPASLFSGALLCSAGPPWSGFPHVNSSYCALRPLGARPARFPLPFRSCPYDRSAETPSQVPGRPCVHGPSYDPVGGMRLKPRRSALPVAHRRILSPSTVREVSAPASESISGTQSRGLYARCLRFKITVTVYLLTILQDSLPAWRSPSSPVGFSPGSFTEISGCYCLPSGQACLAHPRPYYD